MVECATYLYKFIGDSGRFCTTFRCHCISAEPVRTDKVYLPSRCTVPTGWSIKSKKWSRFFSKSVSSNSFVSQMDVGKRCERLVTRIVARGNCGLPTHHKNGETGSINGEKLPRWYAPSLSPHYVPFNPPAYHLSKYRQIAIKLGNWRNFIVRAYDR